MGKKAQDPGAGLRGAALGNYEKAAQMLEKVGIPSVESQQIFLEKPELVGLLSAEQLSPSELTKISEDLGLTNVQMQNLEQLQKIGKEGLATEDKAKFEALQAKIAQDEKARQESILQKMEQQGLSSSGARLISQLQSSQEAAQTGREQSNVLASQSAQARREALSRAGELATGIQTQKLNLAEMKGKAADETQKFNLGLRQNVQAANLAARQQMANVGTDLANQQQMYNKQLAQTRFQNEMAKYGGQANAYAGLGGAQMQASTMIPGKGPSGFAQALGGAMSGAGAMAATGNPYAIAGGAGVGALSTMLEDGGITRAQDGLSSAQNGMSEEEAIQMMGLAPQQANYDQMPQLQNERQIAAQKYLQRMRGSEYQSDLNNQSNPEPIDMQAPVESLADLKRVDEAKIEEGIPSEESNSGKTLAGIGTLSKAFEGLQNQGGNPNAGRSFSNPFNVPTSASVRLPDVQMAKSAQDQYFNLPKMENGGFAYKDGGPVLDHDGSGDIVPEHPMGSKSGDKVPALLNEDEMVLNLDQQQRLLDLIKRANRTDVKVDKGELKINEPQQEMLFKTIKGEMSPEELPYEPVVYDPNTGLPARKKIQLDGDVELKGLKRLIKTLGMKDE